jgi:hypothetical protein
MIKLKFSQITCPYTLSCLFYQSFLFRLNIKCTCRCNSYGKRLWRHLIWFGASSNMQYLFSTFFLYGNKAYSISLSIMLLIHVGISINRWKLAIDVVTLVNAWAASLTCLLINSTREFVRRELYMRLQSFITSPCSDASSFFSMKSCDNNLGLKFKINICQL